MKKNIFNIPPPLAPPCSLLERFIVRAYYASPYVAGTTGASTAFPSDPRTTTIFYPRERKMAPIVKSTKSCGVITLDSGGKLSHLNLLWPMARGGVQRRTSPAQFLVKLSLQQHNSTGFGILELNNRAWLRWNFFVINTTTVDRES